MNNIDKYRKAFITAFDLDETDEINDMKYKETDEWDSVGHMTLISEIESTFVIELSPEDIVEFNSFETGLAILQDRHKISFK